MVRFDPIPQARIVRHAGQLVMPPRAPRTQAVGASALRIAAAYVVGLWPLTCVVMLVVGLLVFTANLHAP
jgi:hypothetical protein